ncbi:lectin-like domain-containing protein [Larkinella sp. VNQ87]|uniref:lectin-like domain-containing protein n=1 Tax=Larkinella sp. VNQ87 TaxID=3400921 RepID=UPI003C0FE529
MKRSTDTPWILFLALTALWLLVSMPVYAQNGYQLVGSAQASSQSDCYELTKAQIAQNGALWNEKPLHLNESFELEFTINLGDNPGGADGIVMVLQTRGNRVLAASPSGIGFSGLTPALGIEFDTHQNVFFGDPRENHIALVRDGNSDHRLISKFDPPVPISTTGASVEDGLDHLVRVKWDAVKHILQVEVDCQLRINQSVDLIKEIFNGGDQVYWGFTSSTGSSYSVYTVCLKKDPVVRDTLQACQGDTLTLIANQSLDDQYSWTPARGLSNPSSRTPSLIASSDQIYTVSYLDRCSVRKTDSVFVEVNIPNLQLGTDRSVCENERLELNPELNPEPVSPRYRWSTGDTTRQIHPKSSGMYSLEVSADGCTAKDSVGVTIHPLPLLETGTDSVFDCPGADPLILQPSATGQGLQYVWTPGNSQEPQLAVTTPGIYKVAIKSGAGCQVSRQFIVNDNCKPLAVLYIPDAFTPNGDGVNDVFNWKSTDVSLEMRLTIFNRWGEVLFFSDNSQEYWDGTLNGVTCPATLYTWRVDYRVKSGTPDEWLTKWGEVLLIR